MTKLQIHAIGYYFYKNKLRHSIHDIPSQQGKYYHISWEENGILHKINGPAMIFPDGEKHWYKNGQYIKSEYPEND